ncbi:T9SS type A sorting domain-containing protein [Flavobacteriaceae bacterium S356]|uniref:T9SS type A sorting domain-containing protein n=1 Tax=Asprobacillus argus TaxID=3076534 RepID=A0ABU3LDR8_9FLAO|nr:T9SS type A sorting domain-containing protein [Flavobacteriaceae bacterium S356]
MKKYYILIIMGLTALTVLSQNVNIPDANFKAALVGDSNINTNSDSEIQVSEAAAFTGTIDVMSQSISNYTGIEAFINITGFDGRFNDVSSIDVSALTKLVTLNLGANTILTSLDVSTNVLLETLSLSECFALTTLTFGNNTALKVLSVREAGLNSLSLSTLIALEDLDANSVGVSNSTPLTTLDFSNNTNLKEVVVRHSNVTILDFSNNAKLTFVEVDFNSMMTSLNIKNGANTILTTLIATNNTNLGSVCVDDVNYAQNQAGWNANGTYTTSCTLSVKDHDFESQVVLYPNPVKNQLNLQLSAHTSIKSMTIFSSTGKRIAITKNNMTDVRSLASGLYFLHIKSDLGEIAIKKFIKE